jgi:hypothetical protein
MIGNLPPKPREVSGMHRAQLDALFRSIFLGTSYGELKFFMEFSDCDGKLYGDDCCL